MTTCFWVDLCYANEVDRPVIEEPAEPQVIATYYISAAKCKLAYEKMTGYNSWTIDIASAVVGYLGDFNGIAGGITQVAALIQKANYNSTKNEFLKGWQNNKGCTMVVYDNVVPWIHAN